MLRAVLQALACLALAATGTAAPLPEGESRATALLAGTPIAVAYYKPRGYAGGPLLISLHGLGRNVDGYLAATRPLADRHGLLVAVPLFDRERFPPWRYQWLGVSRTARTASGEVPVEPRAQCTTALIAELAEQVSAAEGRPLDLWLTGHSATGGGVEMSEASRQDLLAKVGADRRDFLRKIAIAAAFAAPTVATFSLARHAQEGVCPGL